MTDDEFERPSEEKLERWFAGTIESDVKTTEADIDEILYAE